MLLAKTEEKSHMLEMLNKDSNFPTIFCSSRPRYQGMILKDGTFDERFNCKNIGY